MSGVIHTGISDHSLIYTIRKINIITHKNEENIAEIRNMKNFNEQQFLNESWEHVYYFVDNSNSMWDIWKRLFVQILDKHAPLQRQELKAKRTLWITNNIKKMINTRSKLKGKASITELETDWENYKRIRNETNKQLRQAKKDYSNKITGERQNAKKSLQNN